MTSVAELYALQEFDLALAAARSELTDAESRLGESDELQAARQAADERQDELRAAEKRFKEAEFEADELRRKIEPVEQRLYKGTIQNPKELEDLQQDIESLQRRRSSLEDGALEAMDALEQAQSALAEAQRELQALEGASMAEHEQLRARCQELEGEIASLEGRRPEQAARIDERMMRLYEDLAASRHGRGVAKVEGGACQGCRISLPMNLIQRARAGGGIVQCSSCQRILYIS